MPGTCILHTAKRRVQPREEAPRCHIYRMTMRCACCCCLEVIFGNVTVKTPFSILALTSSGYEWVSIRKSSSIRRPSYAYLDPQRDLQRPGELAIATLTDGVSLFMGPVRLLRLTSNRKTVLVDVNIDIVGFHAGKLKRGCHGVGVLGFVNVHPGESRLSGGTQRKDRVFRLPWTEVEQINTLADVYRNRWPETGCDLG